MNRQTEWYRLHPLLLIYPTTIDGKRRLIAEIMTSEPPLVIKDWRFAWSVSALPEKFTKEEALTIWASEPDVAEIAGEIWTVGVEEGLIINGSVLTPSIRRFDFWQTYSWAEASVYQEATRDYPFLQMNCPDAFDSDDERMVQYIQEAKPPDIYQRFPSEFSIPLHKLKVGESANAWLANMTLDESRGLDGLSLLFDVCFGERTKLPFNIQGYFLRKSIPSGGARHPTEVFFASFSGCGIEPGIYHYNVEAHRLDCIQTGDFYEAFEVATFDLFKKFVEPPIGLIAFTSLYERAMWRYRDGRSWRAVPIDIGHALMAFRRVSDALGFGSYTYQKIKDRELCQLFQINCFRQTPFYVGTLV